MAAATPEHARAAMKAALANVELALAHNGAATNAVVLAVANMLAGNPEEANANVMTALQSLRDARTAADSIGHYTIDAFG